MKLRHLRWKAYRQVKVTNLWEETGTAKIGAIDLSTIHLHIFA